MQRYYDHRDMVALFQDSIRKGDKDAATEILLIMAEACPVRSDDCLETKFCPDCDFYKNNGIVNKLQIESMQDKNIPTFKKEE